MTRTEKNLSGLSTDFDDINVHTEYVCGLEHEEFISGMDALAQTFIALYSGMIREPKRYAMKHDDDAKGLAKNMNFLLLLAQKSVNNRNSLIVEGSVFAQALKDARVTKPETYFQMLASLGFITTGLDKKIETSEKITVEFPDNAFLLIALKAMAQAVGAFSRINPNQGNMYFELLDHRVLEKYPSTEPKPTIEYVLSKINKESRDVVEMFCEFIGPLSKCNIKGSIQWYWTPTFTLKKTKKVIMSFKLTQESHAVKLNLANIGAYTDLLDGFPEKMMDVITDGGWECGNCNTKSSTCAFAFDIDGKAYRKCRCGSFIFDNPDQNDAKLLLGLLKKELEMIW